MINSEDLFKKDMQDAAPSYWVFETYCNLSIKLTGQTEKIKSIFNPSERTASFVIYVKNNQYYFKDFSTGVSGDKINLVMKLYNLSFSEALYKIKGDYLNYMSGNPNDIDREFKVQPKYSVSKFNKRNWSKDDAAFWTKYAISSKVLEEYNVISINDFFLQKEEYGIENKIRVSNTMIYGYCRTDGTLYKIYQPTVGRKFMKIKDYIQGTDQLKFNQPNLIITSSLKDIMCLKAFGFNAEYIAPDSETCIIPNAIMAMYKMKYKNIITLFDNDAAGTIATEKFTKLYDTKGVILPLSKDVSDSVRDYGLEKTREVLYPLLKEAINK
jgi:hypothetical protein